MRRLKDGTKLAPLSPESATKAIDAAQEAIKGTDGIVLCVLMVRLNESGRPEIYTPTVSPTQMPPAFVAGVARAYADTVERGSEDALTNGGVSYNRVGIPINSPVSRKARVN